MDENLCKGNWIDVASDVGSPRPPLARGESRPFLGITFSCCDVYARVYRNRAKTAYQGNCPRCARPVRFLIGSGGSDARFFVAE